MPENQAVLFWGLNLGVLRILLFQGRAESPMERLAQGKRSGTLGWVIVSKTIYALKGQKRGYCAFVSHTQCYVLIGLSVRHFFKLFSKCHVFTLLPFQVGCSKLASSNPQLSPSTSFLRVHVHLLLNLQIIRTEIPTSANNIPLPHNAT